MMDIKFPPDVWITHTIASQNWLGPRVTGRAPQAHYRLASEAQAEITRLKAEVERLNTQLTKAREKMRTQKDKIDRLNRQVDLWREKAHRPEALKKGEMTPLEAWRKTRSTQ